jgi:uncharacterized protein YdiU (UPF0061 family)
MLAPSSYAALPEPFFARVAPTPVAAPRLLRFNERLASELGLSMLMGPDGVELLGGNRVSDGLDPIAMAYAGHQFGHWVPSLGDGRAVLLGEVVDRDGVRRDVQLKGAGPTPFSRRGDGRSALGPVVREYVISEAMFALGIPTTRALAMLTTGEFVQRERPLPGGIFTRVAAAHVRVGSFEYFHARGQRAAVQALAYYMIERHFPDCASAPHPYRAFLEEVIARQARLIAQWLLVGFIHGVMNTDNMSIAGETIDYGPCAFMDAYDAAKVYSSIDHGGRYAYDQQPGIGLWNLTRFAETLLPLLADETQAAVEIANQALGGYGPTFERHYEGGLARKLGFPDVADKTRALAGSLLATMAAERADFTLTFRGLSELPTGSSSEDAAVRTLFAEPAAFDAWVRIWRALQAEQGVEDAARRQGMRAVNPAFIPRNHRVQQAIDALIEAQDEGPLDALLAATARPFDDQLERAEYARPPAPHEAVHRTFCGT